MSIYQKGRQGSYKQYQRKEYIKGKSEYNITIFSRSLAQNDQMLPFKDQSNDFRVAHWCQWKCHIAEYTLADIPWGVQLQIQGSGILFCFIGLLILKCISSIKLSFYIQKINPVLIISIDILHIIHSVYWDFGLQMIECDKSILYYKSQKIPAFTFEVSFFINSFKGIGII